MAFRIQIRRDTSVKWAVNNPVLLSAELGYETENLSDESEFIINYTIRKKILQGIYSTKCDGILVCYKSLSQDFLENLENFLEEHSEEFEYTIHSL